MSTIAKTLRMMGRALTNSSEDNAGAWAWLVFGGISAVALFCVITSFMNVIAASALFMTVGVTAWFTINLPSIRSWVERRDHEIAVKREADEHLACIRRYAMKLTETEANKSFLHIHAQALSIYDALDRSEPSLVLIRRVRTLETTCGDLLLAKQRRDAFLWSSSAKQIGDPIRAIAALKERIQVLSEDQPHHRATLESRIEIIQENLSLIEKNSGATSLLQSNIDLITDQLRLINTQISASVDPGSITERVDRAILSSRTANRMVCDIKELPDWLQPEQRDTAPVNGDRVSIHPALNAQMDEMPDNVRDVMRRLRVRA
jgi:hypothetical protein